MIMKLEIFKASDFLGNIKVTIHSTGKIGFTEAAARLLKLSKDTYISIAKDEEDNLYLINNVEQSESAYKVLKSAQYYSVNTRVLFDSLGYDYKNNLFIFDLVKTEIEGFDEVYIMNKRVKPKKK